MMMASYFAAMGARILVSRRRAQQARVQITAFNAENAEVRRERRAYLIFSASSAFRPFLRSAFQAERERDLLAGLALQAEDDRVAGDHRRLAGQDAQAAGLQPQVGPELEAPGALGARGLQQPR
jgi:hypothetical protein